MGEDGGVLTAERSRWLAGRLVEVPGVAAADLLADVRAACRYQPPG
jgi:hypothetical protein